MDAAARRRCVELAYGEIVWSWSPDAGIKRVDSFHARRWLTSRTPGRARRQIIAQGRPECFGVPVFTRVRFALSAVHTRLRVRPCIRPSLRPLYFRGTTTRHHSGKSCRENVGACHPPLSCPAKGASSIPEASRLNTTVSGILDRPIPSPPRLRRGLRSQARRSLGEGASRAMTANWLFEI